MASEDYNLSIYEDLLQVFTSKYKRFKWCLISSFQWSSAHACLYKFLFLMSMPLTDMLPLCTYFLYIHQYQFPISSISLHFFSSSFIFLSLSSKFTNLCSSYLFILIFFSQSHTHTDTHTRFYYLSPSLTHTKTHTHRRTNISSSKKTM